MRLRLGREGGFRGQRWPRGDFGRVRWVFDNAQVFDKAEVSDKAQVYDNARVYGNAMVSNSAAGPCRERVRLTMSSLRTRPRR